MPSRFPAALCVSVAALACALPAHGAATKADLQPAAAAAGLPSKAVAPGARISLSLAVRNVGNRSAGRSATGVFLSKDRRRDASDTRVLRLSTKSVRAGRSARLRSAIKVPAGVAAGEYRLIVCSDLGGRVRERSEGNNCRVLRGVLRIAVAQAPRPVPPTPQRQAQPQAEPKPQTQADAKPEPQRQADPPAPAGPTGPPSLALHLDDGRDWASTTDAGNRRVDVGEVVTLTARMAAGVPGANGYTRSTPADAPFLTGGTPLSFTDDDDGAAPIDLPSGVPFAGIPYDDASVSTNGWVGFADPASDYWDDTQNADYRGIPATVGDFQRGVMPYWLDGDLDPEGPRPGGAVKVVQPAGGDRVAVQWDVNSHEDIDKQPRRTMQALLFGDGRIRFDYKGDRTASTAPDDEAFVGLSGGTGPDSLDVVAGNTYAPPTTAVEYTPRPVSQAAAPAGTLIVSVPAGSSFDSADPECRLVTAPTVLADGSVECSTPTAPAGTPVLRHVRVKVNASPLSQSFAPNHEYGARWSAGGQEVRDGEETIPHTAYDSATVTAALSYTGAAQPKAGAELPFLLAANVNAGAGRHPKVTIDVPAGLKLKTSTIPAELCVGLPADFAGGRITCTLPNGTATLGPDRTLTFVANAPGPYRVVAQVAADNTRPDGEDDDAAVTVVP
jgi:CARDB